MKLSIDKNQLQFVCNKENIVYLGLFGSYARNEEQEKSDVDVLVDFSEVKSFFELAGVQNELESIFKRKIDLVLKKNIKTDLKPYIEKDLITLYEKR